MRVASILLKSRGLGGEGSRGVKVGFGHPLCDEGSQGGHLVGAGEAVMQIVGDVDAKFGRRLRCPGYLWYPLRRITASVARIP